MKLLKNIIDKVALWDFHAKRAEFYRDLANAEKESELLPDFIEAELAIAVARSTRDDSKAYALKRILSRLRDAEGDADKLSLAEAVGSCMPRSDAMLLAAVDRAKGEMKVETLLALAAAVEAQTASKSKLRKVLFVPAAVTPIVVAFCYILSTKSIPVIERIAPPEVWTPFNDSVRSFAHFVINYGLLTLLLTLGAVGLFSYLLPRWAGRTRFRLERINPKISVWLTPVAPYLLPLSIYREFQAGMTMTALAVLLKTGQKLTTALETIHSHATPYMRHHMRVILDHLDDYPTQYVEAFSKGLLSARLLARMASMIRNASSFDEVVIHIGTTGINEVQKQVESSAGKLNTMFLTIAGGLVLFLYVGQMTIGATMRAEMDPIKRQQRMLER